MSLVRFLIFYLVALVRSHDSHLVFLWPRKTSSNWPFWWRKTSSDKDRFPQESEEVFFHWSTTCWVRVIGHNLVGKSQSKSKRGCANAQGYRQLHIGCLAGPLVATVAPVSLSPSNAPLWCRAWLAPGHKRLFRAVAPWRLYLVNWWLRAPMSHKIHTFVCYVCYILFSLFRYIIGYHLKQFCIGGVLNKIWRLAGKVRKEEPVANIRDQLCHGSFLGDLRPVIVIGSCSVTGLLRLLDPFQIYHWQSVPLSWTYLFTLFIVWLSHRLKAV